MSYCPLFWGSIEIYKEYDSLYILERNDKKTCFLFLYGHFCELLAIVLEFLGDLPGPLHSVHVWDAWQKNSSFLHFRDVFVSYYPQFWDFGVIYKAYYTQHIF
jgi:hypothetical protein